MDPTGSMSPISPHFPAISIHSDKTPTALEIQVAIVKESKLPLILNTAKYVSIHIKSRYPLQ